MGNEVPRKVYKVNINFISKIALFDRMAPGDLKLLTKFMKGVGYRAGDIVCREGEKGEHVYFIVKGIMEIIKEGLDGKNVVLTSLRKGRSIGEMAIIDKSPRSATLRAQTDVMLLALSKDKFELLLKEYPQIGIKILKSLAKLLSMNLRKTSSRLADYMSPLV